MRLFICFAILTALVPGSSGASANARDSVTYLLPAPKEAIAFAPFVLAESQGFYAAEGLTVKFRIISGGGTKVGEALAQEEGDLGGALGDTPLVLREHGISVKGVGLLGGHAFLTLIANRARHVAPNSLKGATIGVPSFTDISFYALRALMNSKGLSLKDVTVLALPPGELIDGLGTGKLDAIVGTVDWGVKAERAGVTLDWWSVDTFYPAMAQAILASDSAIAAQPSPIRRFVRATLKALAMIQADPDASAAAYRRVVPNGDFSPAETARIFVLLDRYVYGGQARRGTFDRHVIDRLQMDYIGQGLVARRRPVAEFFTNRFVR